MAAVADARRCRRGSGEARSPGSAADQRLASARIRAAGTVSPRRKPSARELLPDRTRYDALVARGFATRRDAERVLATAAARRRRPTARAPIWA